MLNRRQMIAAALTQNSQPSIDWDIDWKYTDGPLENFGWDKKARGNAKSEMQADGLHLIAQGAGNYVQYQCPVFTAEAAVCELEVTFATLPPDVAQGFRPILSNGARGLQLYCSSGQNYKGIKMQQGKDESGAVPLYPLTGGESVLIRMEFSSTGCKVTVDDSSSYETTLFSEAYTNGNKIFQQSGGETIITALRYSFLEA